MSNNHIPHSDKELVVQRIAEGASTRSAIIGTAVKSNSTAALIAKTESNAIAQHRKAFLMMAQRISDVTLEDRAQLWAAMAWSNKYALTGYHPVTNRRTGNVTSVPIIDLVPDWKSRATALKYLDKIHESVVAGESQDTKSNVQVNFINNSSDFQVTG